MADYTDMFEPAKLRKELMRHPAMPKIRPKAVELVNTCLAILMRDLLPTDPQGQVTVKDLKFDQEGDLWAGIKEELEGLDSGSSFRNAKKRRFEAPVQQAMEVVPPVAAAAEAVTAREIQVDEDDYD